MIYFTSDLHHKHKRIAELTKRNEVVSAEQHDEWLVDLINSEVTNADVLYLLGDISFSRNYEEVARFYKQLKGQKFVVKGNHDDRKVLNQLRENHLIQDWFDYKEIKSEGLHICMMHFPIASWNKMHYGSWMLHGHSHGSYTAPGKILDVGIDSAYNIFDEHRVFSLESLVYYMQSQDVQTVDHHIVNQ